VVGDQAPGRLRRLANRPMTRTVCRACRLLHRGRRGAGPGHIRRRPLRHLFDAARALVPGCLVETTDRSPRPASKTSGQPSWRSRERRLARSDGGGRLRQFFPVGVPHDPSSALTAASTRGRHLRPAISASPLLSIAKSLSAALFVMRTLTSRSAKPRVGTHRQRPSRGRRGRGFRGLVAGIPTGKVPPTPLADGRHQG